MSSRYSGLFFTSHRWKALSIRIDMGSTVRRSIINYLCTSPAPPLQSLTLPVDEADQLDSAVACANPSITTIFSRDTPLGSAIHAFRSPLLHSLSSILTVRYPPLPCGAFEDFLAAIQQFPIFLCMAMPWEAGLRPMMRTPGVYGVRISWGWHGG